MSLRFGSGWLVTYFLICSCTFICSAPPRCAHEIIRRLILPPARAGGPDRCGAPRSGQRGWSTCTPSRVRIPDALSATLPLLNDPWLARHSEVASYGKATGRRVRVARPRFSKPPQIPFELLPRWCLPYELPKPSEGQTVSADFGGIVPDRHETQLP